MKQPFDRVKVMNEAEGSLQGYDCNICHNKGIVYLRQGEEIVSKDCECMKTRESLDRIKKSGLSNLLVNGKLYPNVNPAKIPELLGGDR